MNTTFAELTGVLSDEELSAVAEDLLAALVGEIPAARKDGEETEGARETARLTLAVERLSAVMEKSATPEKAGADADASPAETAEARPALRAAAETTEAWLTFRAAAENGGVSDAGPEAAGPALPARARRAALPDLEDLSDLIRRDSRRCDAGFERY